MRASKVHAAVVVVALAAVVHSAPSPDNAAKILAEARQALGGESRLSAVRTFTVKGEIRYQASQPYGTFEIACELPDKFVQKTVLANLGGSGPSASHSASAAFGGSGGGYGGSGAHFEETTLGFNGDQVILETTNRSQYFRDPNAPASRVPTQAELSRFLPNAHQQFVQMTLALFATSFSSVPLQFLDLPGPDNEPAVIVKDRVSAVLRFDNVTHLPASLDGLHYFDYRDVDGLKVPFRLAWMGAAHRGKPAAMWQEWDVKEVHVNGIDPKVFRSSGR